MSDVSKVSKPVSRPLSPHIQVYRLPLSALIGFISLRFTGAGLAVGTLLVAAFLISAASGEEAYNYVMWIAGSAFGQIILFFWSLGLYFHMCNGIRHLVWDTGRFMEREVNMLTNYIVLAATLILTVGTWVCAYLVS